MRILFTSEELKTCVLPPKRSHPIRPALDAIRFDLLHSKTNDYSSSGAFASPSILEAVRSKYRLASHLFDDFFKYHLGPKLSDFLVEERRREATTAVRRQARVAEVLDSIEV